MKKAGLLTKLVVLALLIASATTMLEINSQLKAAQTQRDDLSRQVASQTQTNADLTDAIEHSNDPDRIADIARDKLGLVAPGEIIFYSMAD